MIKCQKCNKWFKTQKGLNIHSSRMHGKQEIKVRVDYSQMKSILNRIQKLELDNSYLKSRVKNMRSNNYKSTEEIVRLEQDIQRPERTGNEINMSGVVKELKTILKSKEPILQKNFRFSDEELGIIMVNINQIQMVEVM